MGDRLRLKYLFGNIAKSIPGESLAFRKLADFELLYMLDGNALYVADSIRYDVPQGSIVIGRPGTLEQYYWDPDKESHHAYFHFNIVEMPSEWPDVSLWPRVITKPSKLTAELFEHILIHIKEHKDWPYATPSRAATSLVETLLDLSLEDHKEQFADFERGKPEPLRRIIKTMREKFEANAEQKFTLALLAEIGSVSEKHLCRLFKKHLGVSPMQAVKIMRLQLALSLLIRSNLTIKEIGYKCGFTDAFYFSRVFKQVFGVSPTEARKQISKGNIPLPIQNLPQLLTHIKC